MASIKFASVVSDVRGKVGGTVFARNANGSYIRTLMKPVNKLTALQQIKRNNLAIYANSWRELTDANRGEWNDQISNYPYYNRVGIKSYYTGFQLYMKLNLILETAALNQ